MRILALDASTTAVGWCKAQGDQYLASGVYVPTAPNVLQRIWQIENWLSGTWLPAGFSFEQDDALRPDLVILERPTGNHGNIGTSVKLGGVFFSPTRNMRNDSRARRHINPWNPDVKFHTYAEYEDDFRKVMASVDLPLDKPYIEEPEEKE